MVMEILTPLRILEAVKTEAEEIKKKKVDCKIKLDT